MRTFRSIAPLVVLFVALLVKIGCMEILPPGHAVETNQESLSPSMNNSAAASFNNPYDFVGKLHNDGLRFALEYLRAQVNERASQHPEELPGEAKNSIRIYFKEKNLAVSEEGLQKGENIGKNYFVHLSKNRDPLLFVDSVINQAGYTPKQIVYMKRIARADGKNQNLESFKRSLSELNQRASEELGEEDSRPVLIFSAILENSGEYWSKHGSEWKGLRQGRLSPGSLNKSSVESMCDFNWLRIGAVDAIGASSAGLGCLVTTIAYFDCVAIAALAASLTEASYQLLNCWGLL